MRAYLARTGTRSSLWGVFDQCLSSGTNFFLGLVVVRAVTVTEFGMFSLAYVAYTLTLGLARALVFEPLLIRHTRSRPTVATGAPDAFGASVAIGASVGAILAAVGGILSLESSSALITMGFLMPGLLLQDAIRGFWYSRGFQRKAALNDLVWGISALSSLLLLTTFSQDPPVWAFIMAWGLAGTSAGLWGMRGLGHAPALGGSIRWIKGHSRLVGSLLLDYVVTVGVAQASFALVAGIAGAHEFGIMRTALVPLGLLNVLYTGSRFIVLPRIASAIQAPIVSPARLRLPSLLSLGLALAAISWAGLIVFAPDFGTFVVGRTWDNARAAFVPLAGVLVAQAITVGADVAIRGSRRPFDLVTSRAIAGPITLLLTGVGAAAGGAVGASQGMALGYLLTAATLWSFAIARLASPGGQPT